MNEQMEELIDARAMLDPETSRALRFYIKWLRPHTAEILGLLAAPLSYSGGPMQRAVEASVASWSRPSSVPAPAS